MSEKTKRGVIVIVAILLIIVAGCLCRGNLGEKDLRTQVIEEAEVRYGADLEILGYDYESTMSSDGTLNNADDIVVLYVRDRDGNEFSIRGNDNNSRWDNYWSVKYQAELCEYVADKMKTALDNNFVNAELKFNEQVNWNKLGADATFEDGLKYFNIDTDIDELERIAEGEAFKFIGFTGTIEVKNSEDLEWINKKLYANSIFGNFTVEDDSKSSEIHVIEPKGFLKNVVY
jgi:hypothetical protein